MRFILFSALFIITTVQSVIPALPNPYKNTFCNPINVNYNFWESYREAADPGIIFFKNDYYLFASHSDGYWWSTDMANWKLVRPTGIKLTDYAPTVETIGDTLFFTAGGSNLFKTTDPKGGTWSTAATTVLATADPCMFRDNDGKFYCYSGCSANGTIDVIQADPSRNFSQTGSKDICIRSNRTDHGFEVPGDNNENLTGDSWIEGSWMTKYKGIYYLQYAVPGTELRSYSDGCYTASSPRGPFTFCTNSPICMKPGGFVTGTGHSCTFLDAFGKYWHVTTVTIGAAYMFERRLAIFPAAFDSTNILHTDTYLGDYPQYLPGKAPIDATSNLAPGALLSFKKNAVASSTLSGKPASNAFDEDIKSWWSAATSNSGEWLQVDLGEQRDIGAIQVNFAEQDITYTGGRGTSFSHKYKIECADNSNGPWKMLVDKSANTQDIPHDYVILDSLVRTQFVKITNAGPMPGGGKFAVRDLRIFGYSDCNQPAVVSSFSIARSNSDKRMATLTWDKVSDAQGYIIRLGIAADKLYNNYQITNKDSTTCIIRSLNTNVTYYFAIDSYNECGVTRGTLVKREDNFTSEIPKFTVDNSSQKSGYTVYKVINNQFSIPETVNAKAFAVKAYDISGKLLFNILVKERCMDFSQIVSRSSKLLILHVKPIQ